MMIRIPYAWRKAVYWIRLIVFIMAMLVFVFSISKIVVKKLDSAENKWVYQNVRENYYQTQAIYMDVPEPDNAPKPSEPPKLDSKITDETKSESAVNQQIQDKFKTLVAQNADIVGWVKLDNTAIDYPVAQSEDNAFYLSHDVMKQPSKAGSIFLDYRNQLAQTNRNMVLYGHDMLDKSMFETILNYESKWFFENHPIIHFDTIYANQDFRVFSVYTTDVDFNYIRTDFQSNEEYNDFLQTIKDKSLYKTDVEVTDNDTILTLSTCSYAFDNARFVVHAKLIKKR